MRNSHGHSLAHRANDQEPELETRFQEMKRYVAFTDEDAALLAAFRPVAEPHFARISRAFYDSIREHEEAHAVFTGEGRSRGSFNRSSAGSVARCRARTTRPTSPRARRSGAST